MFSTLKFWSISKLICICISKIFLGEQSKNIEWIVEDVLNYDPKQNFDVWHDRAVFHFLTDQNQIKKYVDLVSRNISNNGYLIIGTFSEQGPLKCSGLEGWPRPRQKHRVCQRAPWYLY